MAGHEWEDWFEREELIGQISDLRVQNLQVERESVQKRTFTRWMNLHLEKCNPPIEVQDLFRDIQDGHILLALLEELSGCKLLHGFKKSSHRIFRLNNIAKVLTFLEERNVKLVSIDAADVADGNSSIILGLIWNIILFFQIKELTGNIRSQFPSCSSLSSLPTSSDSDTSSSTPDERQGHSNPLREHSKAIKRLLQWVQRRTRKYGVAVQDFGKSWTSGLAFLAVIKSIDSSLVDMRKALLRTPRENLEDAFRIAHYSLGIPRLLEPEDVTLSTPDDQSIIMYVSQFLEHFPGVEEPEEPLQVIERSVSMGRLNFRENDMDHFRHGHRGVGVRERSYMFQRDSPAPPPKILISSVSEDRGIVSPPFRQAATRSWSTEDFLSSHVEDDIEDNSSSVVHEPQKDATEELSNSESQSPELRDSNSPTDSALPESVIGDSAISSPDSWMESEYNASSEKFCESRSDSSLYDSGTAWDIYRATPVEITNSDEGLAPSEEQQESYIDEGICSLSSMEGAQERVDGPEMKQKEERKEAEVENKEGNLEQQGLNEEIRQMDTNVCDVVKAGKASSMNVSDLVGLDSDKDVIDPSEQPETEDQVKGSVTEQVEKEIKVADFDINEEICQANVENEIAEVNGSLQEVKYECPKLDLEVKEEVKQDDASVERVEIQNKEIKELKDGESDCNNDLKLFDEVDKTPSTSQDSNTLLGPIGGMTIPLISISREPDDQLSGSDLEENNDNFGQTEVSESKEIEASAENDLEKHGVIASCFITENIDLIASEETSDLKNEFKHLEEAVEIVEDSKDGDIYVEMIEDVQDVNVSKNDLESSDLQSGFHSDEPEMVILVSDQQEELCNIFSATEKSTTQETSMDTVKSNGEVVSIVNNNANMPGGHFSTDYRGTMEELVDLEPMDLFYPDKEEPLYAEPAETDVQSWPSVLSVSPLQPAPASDDPSEEQPFPRPEEDWTGEEVGMELVQTPSESQVPDTPFDSQDWFGDDSAKRLSNEEDIIDLRAAPSSARDATGPVRSHVNSCGGGLDGNQIPPVLRHRKGQRSSDPTDNQRSSVSAANKDHISDYGLESWEPCVLLLLWLLLYCFWLLPQLDLKAVPGLFFNTGQ